MSTPVVTDLEALESTLIDCLTVLIEVVGSENTFLVQVAHSAAYNAASALPDDHPFQERTLDVLETHQFESLYAPNTLAVTALNEVLHTLGDAMHQQAQVVV